MDHQELVRRVVHRFEADEETTLKRYGPLADYFVAGQRVLDVGCGTGTLLRELSSRGVRAIGIDLDRALVQKCRAQGLEVYHRRAEGFLDKFHQPLDGILLLHIIEHLDPEAVLRLLNQAVTALNPGGKIIIVTPNIENEMVYSRNFWLDISHKRPYPLLLLQAVLEILGMDIYAAGEATWSPADLLIVGVKEGQDG